MFNKIITTSLFTLALGLLFSPSVFADEYVISGNGSGSNNTIETTSTNSNNVSQSNTANIDNTVNQNANTGNNSASSNIGDTSIVTGSSQSTSNVVNQGINMNSVDNNCNCPENSLSIKISGNGANSINGIDVGFSNNQGAIQSNSAMITSNIYSHSNTGYNFVNNNNGNVVIDTGNALSLVNVKNKNINLNTASLGMTAGGLISVSISGNGVGSINLLDLIFNNSNVYESTNIALIYNNVESMVNTGHNSASNNNGSVLISTGDAISVVDIANENINGSSAELCACKITPPTGGENPPPASPPTSSGGNGGSTISQSAGQVLGAALGSILPATGGYWMLLLTLLCLTLFLAGGYLRFGSGISPPFSYAV